MLTLAFTDRADVRDDNLIRSDAMFAPQRRAIMSAAKGLNIIQPDPAGDDLEIVRSIMIFVVCAGGLTKKQRAGCLFERLAHERVQSEWQAALEEAEDRIAFVNIQERGLVRLRGEMDAPEAH